MDTTKMVMYEIEAGRQMVDTLDLANLRPKVALWLTTPEYEEGRVVLAAPEYDTEEPLKAYESMAVALGDRFPLQLPPVLLLHMDDPMIEALRDRFAKAAYTEGMRLGGHRIGNRFVEDAYVYRIT